MTELEYIDVVNLATIGAIQHLMRELMPRAEWSDDFVTVCRALRKWEQETQRGVKCGPPPCSCKPDAARYRWLRYATAGDWEVLNDLRLAEGMKKMDSAIDAKMANRATEQVSPVHHSAQSTERGQGTEGES